MGSTISMSSMGVMKHVTAITTKASDLTTPELKQPDIQMKSEAVNDYLNVMGEIKSVMSAYQDFVTDDFRRISMLLNEFKLEDEHLLK